MASMSPVSPPASPRQSYLSSSSGHTHSFTPLPRPLVPPPPPHHENHRLAPDSHDSLPKLNIPNASTSTISRDSRTSAEDRPASSQSPKSSRLSSPHPPLLPSVSSTRLPKARVFVHRESHADRPRNRSQHSEGQFRTLTPPHIATNSALKRQFEKRCVSDLQPTAHAQPIREGSGSTHNPAAWGMNRCVTDVHNTVHRSPSHHSEVPKWIPSDEMHNWAPSPMQKPCVLEEEPASRWANSMRNISNFCKNREKSPPRIRGSILEVQPPTLTERFGLSALGDRGQSSRDIRARNTAGRGRVPRRSKASAQEQPIRSDNHTAADFLEEEEEYVRGGGRDEYVGFLIESGEERKPKQRRSWRRFFRRIKK